MALTSEQQLQSGITSLLNRIENRYSVWSDAKSLLQDLKDYAVSGTSTTLPNIIIAGSVGSNTQIPVFTYDTKGRITSVSSTTVASAAGSSGITSINNQLQMFQTLVSGSTGADTNIVSVGGVHTLNIPTIASSGVTRGLLSASDYNRINAALTGITPTNQLQSSRFFGDVYGSGTTAVTLTLNTITTAGSVGSSTQIPVLTYNSKGLIISSTTVAVAGGAGSSGITSINNQLQSFQTIITGSTGLDFNIVSAGGVHTINIPSITTATTRGILDIGYFNKFNNYINDSATTSNQQTWSVDAIKNYVNNNPNLSISRGFVSSTTFIDWSAYDIQVLTLGSNLQISAITNTSLGKTILETNGAGALTFSPSLIPISNISGYQNIGQTSYVTLQCLNTSGNTFTAEWFNPSTTLRIPITAATYTASTTNLGMRTIFGMKSVSGRTLYFPNPALLPSNLVFTVKDESGTASVSNIIIVGVNSTIDGAASLTLSQSFVSRDFYNDGSNYFII